MPTPQDIERLKTLVKRGLREPDKWFGENDTVTLPPASGTLYWRSLRVNLLGYAYGEGDEGDADEPEFITAMSVDGIKDLAHEPQVPDPPTVGRNTRVLPDRRVLLHQSLDDGKSHEFFVVSSAFDSDSDTAWSGVVKGLRSDLRTVGSAAIGSSLLSGFQTPGALMDFVIQHAGDAATDEPEQIGSQEVVLDLRQEFRRPEGITSWTIHKWTLFSRPGQAAWYLALWRIDLDSRAGALAAHRAMDRRDDAIDLGGLRDSLQVGPTELAAVRVLQGEAHGPVAKALDLSEVAVREAVAAFVDQEASAIERRLMAVALAEQRLLRARLTG